MLGVVCIKCVLTFKVSLQEGRVVRECQPGEDSSGLVDESGPSGLVEQENLGFLRLRGQKIPDFELLLLFGADLGKQTRERP